MSSYGITATGPEHPFGTNFDKIHHFQNALHNKANFSVSHLLDLEELPSENCAMFANTDPRQHVLQSPQTCSPPLLAAPSHPRASETEEHAQDRQDNSNSEFFLKYHFHILLLFLFIFLFVVTYNYS